VISDENQDVSVEAEKYDSKDLPFLTVSCLLKNKQLKEIIEMSKTKANTLVRDFLRSESTVVE